MPNKDLMETVIQPPSDDNQSYLGVKDNPDYVRDAYSKAVFITNEKQIQEYLDKKRMREAQKETSERLNSLETDVSEIKSLLKQLINKM